jgi:uncharacterized membrane protein YqiK
VDAAYLRTGLGKPKVLLGRGGFVLPFLHTLTPVNLQTYSLELCLQGANSLISKDLLRVDVLMVFSVRVAAQVNSIQLAARVLGEINLQRDTIKSLLEAEGTAVLRGTAAMMSFNTVHQQRHDFTETVNRRLNLQLRKYGLEVVSTALMKVEQTPKSYYDPQQVLDAQGLMLLEKAQFAYAKQRQVQRWDAELSARRHDFHSAVQRMVWERDEFSARLQHIRFKAEADAKAEQELEEIQLAKDMVLEMVQRDVQLMRIQTEQELAAAQTVIPLKLVSA